MARVRSFVAILLDDDTRAVLGDEVARLRGIARDVGWVATENLHVTVKFLGGVDEERLGDVRAGLDGAVAGVRAFDVSVDGLGAFPTTTRARVVWAGLGAGRDALADVAERIEQALEPLGFPREARGFSPHVTLGRVRVPRRDAKLADALAAASVRRFGVVRVDRVSLMRSDLSPRGARYTELSAHRLR